MAQLEVIMYILLGFATAALLALFIGRLAWLYALRLGRLRAQRSGPPAVAELQSDRDRLRAEQAMLARRLEVRMDALKGQLAEHMAEISRHRNRIDHLGEEIAQRDATLSQRAAEVARLTEQVGHLESELASRTEALHQLKEEVRQRDDSHAALAHDLDAARQAIAERDRQIEQLRAEVDRFSLAQSDVAAGAQTQQRLVSRIEDLSHLSQQIEAQRRELTDKQSQYHTLREKIAELRHKDEAPSADVQAHPALGAARGEAAPGVHHADFGGDRPGEPAEEVLQRRIGDTERHTAEIEKELERLDAEWSAKLAELAGAIAPGRPPVEPGEPDETTQSLPNRSAAPDEDPHRDNGEREDKAAPTDEERKAVPGLANVISLANRIRALQREDNG